MRLSDKDVFLKLMHARKQLAFTLVAGNNAHRKDTSTQNTWSASAFSVCYWMRLYFMQDSNSNQVFQNASISNISVTLQDL